MPRSAKSEEEKHEYHRIKSYESYLRSRDNGIYQEALREKNERYATDEAFKERIKQYNKEQYRVRKQEASVVGAT